MSEDIRRIPLAQIVVSDRIRPVEPAWADAIAASMEEMGQKTPIVVRPLPDGKFDLVAGAHRLEGAKRNGWSEILASVEALDDLQARLVEIDENLMRRELGPLDRALFLAERKRVYLELCPETGHGKAKKPKKGSEEEKTQSLRLLLPRSFKATVAEKIGMSERSIQLSLLIAEGLDPTLIEKLRASPIVDNQAALQALAGMSPGEQRAVVIAFAEDGCTTLAAAKRRAGLAEDREIDPVAEQIAKATAWFAKWDHRSQAAFLDTCQKMRRKGAA